MVDMKLFLDDKRKCPPGYTLCRWPEDVIQLLKTEKVSEVSLDHDLGDDVHGTGNDVILWIEEQVATSDFIPPIIKVHSDNPPGVRKMTAGINAILRLVSKR